MGWFGESLKSAAGSLVSGLGGGLGGAISGAVSALLGPSPAKQMRMQKDLMKYQADLSYQYGEKAANNAFGRNLQMYQRQFNDQSFETQRSLMEDAGLSVGLMYGGGGAGGGGGASTHGQPQGYTSVSGGAAPNAAAFQAAATQQAQLGLQMLNAKRDADLKEAQKNALDAEAEQKRAEAGLQTEKKITETQSRQALIASLVEKGRSDFVNTMIRLYNVSGESDPENAKPWEVTHDIYGAFTIDPKGMERREQLEEMRLTMQKAFEAEGNTAYLQACKLLKTEEAQYYFYELTTQRMIADANQKIADAAGKNAEAAQKQADAAQGRAIAYAQQVSHMTGETVNWKTYYDMATEWGKIAADLGGEIMMYKGLKGRPVAPTKTGTRETTYKLDKKTGEFIPTSWRDVEFRY